MNHKRSPRYCSQVEKCPFSQDVYTERSEVMSAFSFIWLRKRVYICIQKVLIQCFLNLCQLIYIENNVHTGNFTFSNANRFNVISMKTPVSYLWLLTSFHSKVYMERHKAEISQHDTEENQHYLILRLTVKLQESRQCGTGTDRSTEQDRQPQNTHT